MNQQGFQIAQQGLQECVDAKFDAMEQERKRIRTSQEVPPRTPEGIFKCVFTQQKMPSHLSNILQWDGSEISEINL